MGRRVGVRAAKPLDSQWCYDVATGTPAGFHWRLHGEVPTYEEFVQGLLGRAKATTIAYELETGQPFGMVQLLNHDPLSRTAYLSTFLTPSHEGRGWPLEAVILYCGYAFSAFDLRKIYIESLATEAVRYRSLVGGLLQEEGVLKGHKYVMGTYVDCHVYALYREAFVDAVAVLAPPPA